MSGAITAYKAVRLDMTSHYDKATRWEPGEPVRVENPDPPTENGCGRGIHVTRTLLGAVGFQDGPSEYLAVSVQPMHIIQETRKLRVSECLPLRVLSAKEQDELSGMRLWEANRPVNPLLVQGNGLPDEELRALLKDWASVRDSVGYGVGYSVGYSVFGYIGSLFSNITTWYGTDREHPWDSLRALWLAGYVPSYDGVTWRLHRGPDAEVVLSVPAKELRA